MSFVWDAKERLLWFWCAQCLSRGWFCLTVRVYLTIDLSTLQERAQRLCQEIEKQVKSGKTIPEGKVPACKITEVKTKLVEVMRIMLDNRLEFNEECTSQCGKRMQLWNYSVQLSVAI